MCTDEIKHIRQGRLSPVYRLWNIVLALIMPVLAFAQHDNVWIFGANAGLDFKTSPPTAIRGRINAKEGVASICDQTGQLLFYTDGTTAYDRANNVMQSGGNLVEGGSTGSTSQGAVIVPMPGDENKFYIFSMVNWESPAYFGRLYYSVVDMKGNGGLGAVATKANLLDSFLTEHMTAVSGNNCNAWVIAVSRLNNSFKAYEVNVNGIEKSPVVSQGAETKTLLFFSEMSGNIDVAPDRSKLAIAQENVILYDFDINYGTVTKPVILDTYPPGAASYGATFYGISFSPDNTKLYASLSEVGDDPRQGLYQFDLSSGDSLTMVGSKTLITGRLIYAIRRAPDGKVYCTGGPISFGTSDNRKLHVVQRPDSAGTACRFEDDAQAVLVGTSPLIGLPNVGTIFTHRRFYSITLDSSYCSGIRTLSARNTGGSEYVWNDGITGIERPVTEQGIYWVKYHLPINSPCKYDVHVDTFHVVFARNSSYPGTSLSRTAMCQADTIQLRALADASSAYIWNDGLQGRERIVRNPGHYWVNYQIDSLCIFYRDSFLIIYPGQDPRVDFAADTLVCTNQRVSFQNLSHPAYREFQWLFGDGLTAELKDAEHNYAAAGSYNALLVGVINDLCRDTLELAITVDSVYAPFFEISPRSICAGEAIQIKNNSYNSTVQRLEWVYGDGQTNQHTEPLVEHAYDHAGRFPIQLTAVYRVCPPALYQDSVYVYPQPDLYLGNDTGLCFTNGSLLLYNKRGSDNSDVQYRWSTGEVSMAIKITAPGQYALTAIQEPLGCKATSYIDIYKDCYIDIPNAFSPNGDGTNDYFFPRQLLGKGLLQFHMQVFDRWGRVVFETASTEGIGWDGRFNGRDLPEGVYVYLMQTETANGRGERYRGNVTLIR